MSDDDQKPERSQPATPEPEAGTDKATDAPASDTAEARQRAQRKKKVLARRGVRLTIAFVSFIAGLIISPYAEELITRTNPGFFGPDNQQVIDEQQANFALLESKLKELQLVAGDDPKAQALIAEVRAGLNEQQALAKKQNELFKETEVQNRVLSDRLRQQTGTGSAVDFWLKVGESVTLIDRDIPFAVLGIYTDDTQIRVNLSGQDRRVAVGDPLVFDTSRGRHAVIFRQAKRGSDGRYGFDLTKTERLDDTGAAE